MKLTGILFFLCSFWQVFGQENVVSVVDGYVLSKETEEPIPYAKIYNKSAKNGTISNTDGYFRLQIQGTNDSIYITQIGYKKESFQVLSDQKFYTIYLEENVQELGEVIARPSDNSYLFEQINQCKKNATTPRVQSKAYYELKSFLDTTQIELVEGYYNLELGGYDIKSLDIKAGRMALQPYQSSLFTSQESSRALTMQQLTKSSDYFPSTPFDLSKRDAKKHFYLSVERKYVDEVGDSIYVIYYTPKDTSGYFFEGKAWVDITNFKVEKITMNCERCKTHPFLPMVPDSIANVSLAITKSFVKMGDQQVLNHVDFTYGIDYVSFSSKNNEPFSTNWRETSEETKYSIHTSAVLYAYSFDQSFSLPEFDFPSNAGDYRKLNALPYNRFFWENNNEYDLNDLRSRNEQFFSSPNSINNLKFFQAQSYSYGAFGGAPKDRDSSLKKRGLFEHPYVQWSGKRIFLREMIADSTTAQILGDIKSRQYNLEVKIFADFNRYNDSSNVLTATIMDPYSTYYYLSMDVYANCFINMYFDLCEIQRRQLESEFAAETLSVETYNEIYDRFTMSSEKQRALFLKEVERGTNRREMEKWNAYIKEQLGIDSIALFRLYQEDPTTN